jgi:hypothetical protein
MQQHPHKEILSSILYAFQTRTTAGLTKHLGKIKTYNKSKDNDIADHLESTFAAGQPP